MASLEGSRVIVLWGDGKYDTGTVVQDETENDPEAHLLVRIWELGGREGDVWVRLKNIAVPATGQGTYRRVLDKEEE